MLSNYNKVVFINCGSPTPMWLASNQNHAQVVRILLQSECDFLREAPDGTTPLMIALLKAYPEVTFY